MVFFLTGNPGLIGYYTTFLRLLAEGAGRDAVVAGASLGGFETGHAPRDEQPLEGKLLYPPSFEKKAVYDLRDQIELSWVRLGYLVGRIKQTYPVAAELSVQVVLVGHSVGAYIALELVRRHNELLHDRSRPMDDETARFGSSYDIRATMLLTPTIHDIARSPSGKIATPVLSTLPFFPALVQFGAGILTGTLVESWLRSLVMSVTGMKRGDGLDATVSFLKTPGAVKQALYMARCEMLEIGEANWTEDIWGATDVGPVEDRSSAESNSGINSSKGVIKTSNPPKHYFLFAKEDHWVASVTRDATVEKMSDRATITTDESGSMGLVHAWCLQQSEMVADIVNEWLEDTLARQPK